MLLYSPYKIHAYIAQAHATKKLDCYVVHVLTGQLLSPVSFVNYDVANSPSVDVAYYPRL